MATVTGASQQQRTVEGQRMERGRGDDNNRVCVCVCVCVWGGFTRWRQPAVSSELGHRCVCVCVCVCVYEVITGEESLLVLIRLCFCLFVCWHFISVVFIKTSSHNNLCGRCCRVFIPPGARALSTEGHIVWLIFAFKFLSKASMPQTRLRGEDQ